MLEDGLIRKSNHFYEPIIPNRIMEDIHASTYKSIPKYLKSLTSTPPILKSEIQKFNNFDKD